MTCAEWLLVFPGDYAPEYNGTEVTFDGVIDFSDAAHCAWLVEWKWWYLDVEYTG